MDWKISPNLFRFWLCTVKGATKWMVEWPDIVCGLVGIGAYARMMSEGALIVQFASGLHLSLVSQDAQR